MPGQGHKGPKHEATSAVADAVKRSGKRQAKSATSSPAYKALRAAGASKDRLRALAVVHREGFSTRDLIVFAADLLYEAQDGMREPAGDDDGAAAMSKAKALVQIEKALELLRKLVESDQPSTARDIRLHVTIGVDEAQRAAQAGNGATVVSGQDLPEPGSG